MSMAQLVIDSANPGEHHRARESGMLQMLMALPSLSIGSPTGDRYGCLSFED